jgi:hypothetical protein
MGSFTDILFAACSIGADSMVKRTLTNFKNNSRGPSNYSTPKDIRDFFDDFAPLSRSKR